MVTLPLKGVKRCFLPFQNAKPDPFKTIGFPFPKIQA